MINAQSSSILACSCSCILMYEPSTLSQQAICYIAKSNKNYFQESYCITELAYKNSTFLMIFMTGQKLKPMRILYYGRWTVNVVTRINFVMYSLALDM